MLSGTDRNLWVQTRDDIDEKVAALVQQLLNAHAKTLDKDPAYIAGQIEGLRIARELLDEVGKNLAEPNKDHRENQSNG